MKLALSSVNHDRTKGKRIAFMLLLAFFLMPVAWPQVVCEGRTPAAEKVLVGNDNGPELMAHPKIVTLE